MLSIIGERDGLRLAKSQLLEEQRAMTDKMQKMRGQIAQMTRQLESGVGAKPFHAAVPFEFLSLISSGIVEMRLMAHEAQSLSTKAAKFTGDGLGGDAPHTEFAEIRQLQDLSLSLFPPRETESDDEGETSVQAGARGTGRRDEDGGEEGVFWDLALRLLDNTKQVFKSCAPQASALLGGGDGGMFMTESLLEAQDRILQLHANMDLRSRIQRCVCVYVCDSVCVRERVRAREYTRTRGANEDMSVSANVCTRMRAQGCGACICVIYHRMSRETLERLMGHLKGAKRMLAEEARIQLQLYGESLGLPAAPPSAAPPTAPSAAPATVDLEQEPSQESAHLYKQGAIELAQVIILFTSYFSCR